MTAASEQSLESMVYWNVEPVFPFALTFQVPVVLLNMDEWRRQVTHRSAAPPSGGSQGEASSWTSSSPAQSLGKHSVRSGC